MRSSAILAALALIIPISLASPAEAVPSIVIGGCSVDTAATVTPGLTLDSQNFGYSYSGTLSNCFYTGTGSSATGGLITAGHTIDIDGRAYQEPTPTGHGSCLLTSATGYDFTRWNNGNQTIVQFTATSLGGDTTITGKVIASLELKAVDPAPGEPSTATFRTNQFNGQKIAGLLDFGASNVSVCLTPQGLTNAAITGELTHSSLVN